MNEYLNPTTTKAKGVLNSIKIAADQGARMIHIHLDCLELVNMVNLPRKANHKRMRGNVTLNRKNENEKDRTHLRRLVSQISQILDDFQASSINHFRRSNNFVARDLTKWASE